MPLGALGEYPRLSTTYYMLLGHLKPQDIRSAHSSLSNSSFVNGVVLHSLHYNLWNVPPEVNTEIKRMYRDYNLK